MEIAGPYTLGIVVLGVLVLLFLGTPIGVALGLSAFVGFSMTSGAEAAISRLGDVAYYTFLNYAFSPIILFIFMGEIIVITGIGAHLFEAVSGWVGRIPGSLAVSSIGASGVFGAISGVSTAGTLVIGELAIPEMQKRGYSNSMATGVVAAGGTLSIMIPPSVAFVLYGVASEQSIGALFIAGAIPGVIEVILYSIFVILHGMRHPETSSLTRVSWQDRVSSLKVLVPIAVLFFTILGSIYLGLATPSEAGALGASGALVLAVIYRRLNLRNLIVACRQTALLVGTFLIIAVGAIFFGYYLSLTGYTDQLVTMMVNLPIPPLAVVGMICLILIIMGCFMEIASIIFITTPLVLPAITALGFDPIWYGVILIVTAEMAFITPPVGLNLFVIRSIAPDVPMADIIKGAVPFVIIDMGMIGLLMAFPMLATWLPQQMLSVS